MEKTLDIRSNIDWDKQDKRAAEIELEVRRELGPGANNQTVQELTETRLSKERGD